MDFWTVSRFFALMNKAATNAKKQKQKTSEDHTGGYHKGHSTWNQPAKDSHF
jgi:hypothetical protein